MASPLAQYGALQEKNFLLYSIGSIIAMIGRQMLTVAVGWEIYEKTGSALALGYIGLMQLIPVIILTLPAGQIVDSFNRRKVLIGAQIMNGLATGGLFALSLTGGAVEAMYLCLLLVGIGRAFHSPANAALLPQIVSKKHFTNAVTWSSIFFQAAAIAGPAVGGLLLAMYHSAAVVYLTDFLCGMIFWIILLFVKSHNIHTPKRAISLQSLGSGLKFVWDTKIILAAITLDMFAVLFGGAVALLPVYAKDILHVGPGGLGWLQTAPSIGAIVMGFFLARTPGFRNAGKWLLWSIIGFGIMTIIFGLSQQFWFSFAALILIGMFDNVSVIIRQALVQLRTPDEMRGRVSAINYVFIGTSNELGGFESGLVAHWFGPVFSVVFGGFATIITVLWVAFKWPQLRFMDRLEEEKPESGPGHSHPSAT